jgi:hypothetical protein
MAPMAIYSPVLPMKNKLFNDKQDKPSINSGVAGSDLKKI